VRNLDADQLSDERRVELVSGHDLWHLEAVPELDLGPIMVTDGPHGLRKTVGESLRDEAKSLPATCFPTASSQGATWDSALMAEVGAALGREARTNDVAVVLGPGVNIKRHPLCGRNFEYFSEDPRLSGQLAAAFITGVQSLGVGTSLKHFAVNNQESHRTVVDAVVDERTLREIYLPAFEIAIREARPWTVMCAYNKLNGTYCGEHRHLLTTILRDEWGFEGLVMSDWGANNIRTAGISAGLDLEMPSSGGAHDATVLEALDNGTLPRPDLDRCVDRVLHLIERSEAGASTPTPTCDLDDHHHLARRVAAAGTVLLKNDDALPIDPSARVALIGEFATQPHFQGGGSSQVNAFRIDRTLDEMRRLATDAGGRVQYAPGYERDTDNHRGDLIDEAVAIARNADVAVVIAGLPPAWECEAFDREHLRLPAQHDRLIRAVTAANPNTVVVLVNGAPVAMPWVDHPRAIVEAYLGGQAAGGAIADVLFGIAEPGGRLAESFPVRRQDLASDAWFPGSPRQVQYREGPFVGYRWLDTVGADVLFPFGHGLSYTTFSLTEVTASATAIEAGDEVKVSTTVTNTGDRAGSQVVQIYVGRADAPVPTPVHELAAFEKVHLEAGESQVVELPLEPRVFAHWDVDSGGWQTVGGMVEIGVGTSSRQIVEQIDLEVHSAFRNEARPDLVAYLAPEADGWSVADPAFEALLGRPIPAIDPARPFNRNSTLGEISGTWFGRPLVTAIRFGVAKAVATVESDQPLEAMIGRTIVEMPLRSLATMSNGAISLRALDRTIATMNRLAPRPDQAD
jgi:beta-glucosidase